MNAEDEQMKLQSTILYNLEVTILKENEHGKNKQ